MGFAGQVDRPPRLGGSKHSFGLCAHLSHSTNT
jgi:hypothetical protein